MIILEDYRWIDHPDTHHVLGFLLEHQPLSVHFLISTLAEPSLSLTRLGACGAVAE